MTCGDCNNDNDNDLFFHFQNRLIHSWIFASFHPILSSPVAAVFLPATFLLCSFASTADFLVSLVLILSTMVLSEWTREFLILQLFQEDEVVTACRAPAAKHPKYRPRQAPSSSSSSSSLGLWQLWLNRRFKCYNDDEEGNGPWVLAGLCGLGGVATLEEEEMKRENRMHG